MIFFRYLKQTLSLSEEPLREAIPLLSSMGMHQQKLALLIHTQRSPNLHHGFAGNPTDQQSGFGHTPCKTSEVGKIIDIH